MHIRMHAWVYLHSCIYICTFRYAWAWNVQNDVRLYHIQTHTQAWHHKKTETSSMLSEYEAWRSMSHEHLSCIRLPACPLEGLLENLVPLRANSPSSVIFLHSWSRSLILSISLNILHAKITFARRSVVIRWISTPGGGEWQNDNSFKVHKIAWHWDICTYACAHTYNTHTSLILVLWHVIECIR